jgi:hypothetical protein
MPPAEKDEFSRLNRQFYRSEPAAILVMKLNVLIFAASKSIQDVSATIAGSTFESLTVRIAEGTSVDENDERAQQSYLISETHSVWYQASEWPDAPLSRSYRTRRVSVDRPRTVADRSHIQRDAGEDCEPHH